MIADLSAAITSLGSPALADSALLRDLACVGGEWRPARNGAVRVIANPATGAPIGTVPAMGAREAADAVRAAETAWPAWRAMPAVERAAILHLWSGLMRRHREDLATLITAEQGKPIAESRGEIDYAAAFPDWFAEDALRMVAELPPPHLPGCTVTVSREPVGITAAATPWNFPVAMIARKAGAALAAGCPMVVHPAEETPLSALALAELGNRAGLPPGVLSVITGPPEPVVGAWCADARVRALSFTGSTAVGRRLLAQCAPTVKRVQLELGGHAPFIVFDDAPLVEAIAGAMAAKFATSGQDCLAANRIYIHRAIYPAFLDRFAAAVSELAVGDGFDEGVAIGPLIHERAVRKCEEQVGDALGKGARLLAGGARHALGGTFYQPTALANVTPAMRIYREETFGPVAALIPFDNGDDIAAMANDSEYGLAAYLFTADAARIRTLVGRLEYGMIAVNRVKMTGAPVPFGGIKQSGLGREGSRHGIEAFTEIKYVCQAA